MISCCLARSRPTISKTLEKTMRSFVNKKLPFTGREVSAEEAKKLFKDQPFKLDLINDFSGTASRARKRKN